MGKVYFTTFSTPDFKVYQNELIESARKFGIRNFFTHNSKQLRKTSFYKSHHEIFSHDRGFGYWIWKPYYILEALNRVNEGDIIFYADSGCLLIENPNVLIEICKKNESGIVAFDAWPLTNQQWCKRDAFVIMNCDSEEFWFAKHVIATTMLIRKSSFTVSFVTEWLKYCCNIHALTEIENKYGINKEGFVKHMGDQPIFSLLINKYKIETYRNPSKWGNFLKLRDFRVLGEFVVYPYQVENSITDYSQVPYDNSPFGTIFIYNRKQNCPRRTRLQIVKEYTLQYLKTIKR
jgi:hypothetical protein